VGEVEVEKWKGSSIIPLDGYKDPECERGGGEGGRAMALRSRCPSAVPQQFHYAFFLYNFLKQKVNSQKNKKERKCELCLGQHQTTD